MEQLVDPWAEYSFTHVFCELFKYGKRVDLAVLFTLHSDNQVCSGRQREALARASPPL